MNAITRAVQAVFNFIVGDMRVLVGTLGALLVTAAVVRVAPVAAGVLLVALLVLTLVVALQREIKP